MINVAPLRAAARAAPGDAVGVSKVEFEQLLDEVEEGQRAKRELRILTAISASAGIDGVSAPAD
jgi:hypothetical protein